MNKTTPFRDQLHIDHIRNRLWCDREFGQASVMVGAGFSRNADRTSASVLHFPVWADLAAKMYESLYPQGDLSDLDFDEAKSRAISGMGALKLAEEYEEVFGRVGLDDFLIQSTP